MFHEDKQGNLVLSPKASFAIGLLGGVLVLCTLGFFILLGVVMKGGMPSKKDVAAKPSAAAPTAAAPTAAAPSVPEETVGDVPPVTDEDHIRGELKNYEVTLVEYSDFECPFCKRFHPTAEALVAAFPDKVNWVYRHFPLDFHNPAAQREAEASECVAELAGNEAFWRYANAIYAATPSNGEGVDEAGLERLAKDEGIDPGRFSECLASGRHVKRVDEDFREGQAVGVTGTPGNFLRDNRTGRTLVRPGAIDLDRLKRDVATLLESNG